MESDPSEGGRAAGEWAASLGPSAPSVIMLVQGGCLRLVVCIEDEDVMTSLVSRVRTPPASPGRPHSASTELRVTVAAFPMWSGQWVQAVEACGSLGRAWRVGGQQ